MGTSSQDENGTLDFWRDWDLSDLTEAEYLSKVLGPKYLSLRLVIPLTIAYVVIFITGVFGNVATCTVIIRNSSMQTATNYYLFSLAISDLTLLILGERTKGDTQMSGCSRFSVLPLHLERYFRSLIFLNFQCNLNQLFHMIPFSHSFHLLTRENIKRNHVSDVSQNNLVRFND